jgi:DNA-binding protein Fis
MSISLYDFLKEEIKKMVSSLGRNEKGNIHPLVMNELERYIITLVLEETNHNYFRAAKALGISRSTLYRRIDALGIQRRDKLSNLQNQI